MGMKKTVIINGVNYTVEYGNSSYMLLERDYGMDFRQSDFQQLAKADNPSFSTMYKFVLLGLLKHNKNEDLFELIDEMDIAEMSTKIEKIFAPAFRSSLPDEEKVEDLKEEVGNDKEE